MKKVFSLHSLVLMLCALLLIAVMLTSVSVAKYAVDIGQVDSFDLQIIPPWESTELSFDYDAKFGPRDYDGRSYRVFYVTEKLSQQEFLPEDQTSDVNKALALRNETVKNRFDINYEAVERNDYTYTTLYSHVQYCLNAIGVSEIDFCDIISTYVVALGQLVTNKLLIDWESLPYTDLSASWWDSTINNELYCDGRIYTPVGSMNVSALTYTVSFIMNKDLAAQHRIYDEVIATVLSDKWTIDYFSGLVSDIYQDIDAVDGRSNGDFYGAMLETKTHLDMFQFGFDIPMIDQDQETGLKLVWGQGEYESKLNNAVDKLIDLYWNNDGTYCVNDGTNGIHPKTGFRNNRTIFVTANISDVVNKEKEYPNQSFTILPYPKYDENQQKYLSGMADNYMQLCMPKTVNDPEFVSIITEAMNIESKRTVWPAYYTHALGENIDDTNSFKMFDILMEGRTADIAVPFNTNVGASMNVRAVVSSKNNTIISDIQNKLVAYNNGVNTIVEAYRASASNYTPPENEPATSTSS